MKTIKNQTFAILFILVLTYGCQHHEPVLIPEWQPLDFSLIDRQPAWSPDGQWIAFVHGDATPGKSGIYLISPDGQHIKQWHNQFGESPAWSPDGQWIAFSTGNIWKKKLNGDSLKQLTFEGKNFNPSWSFEKEIIAFRRSYSWPEEKSVQGIYTINVLDEMNMQVFSGNCGNPAWLDKQTLSFFRGVVDNKGRVIGNSLFSINLKNSEIDTITFLKSRDCRYPKYSPINNKIIYDSKDQTGSRQIWVMNVDGTGQRQLTDTQAYSCDWSPDGKHIVYSDTRRDNGRLWIMDADGGNKRQLTFEYHF